MPTKPSANAQVRELLARIGAPPAAPAAGSGPEESGDLGSVSVPSQSRPTSREPDAAQAEARESARAAMRKAMGLPPLPPTTTGAPMGVVVSPAVAGVPNSGGSPLATGRNRSAPAASGRPWRSEVAARIVAQRAGGRCECDGACGGSCGAGPRRCPVRQGDRIPGPRDFPGESRTAVLLCEPTPAASWRGTIVESELTVRCTECSERFAARALRASAPVRAGGRCGRAAASGRGASAGGDDADVFAD